MPAARFYGFSETAQRNVPCRVDWSIDGEILNSRNIAKNSQFGWGKWDSVARVESKFGDCWDVSTPSHGGFILVTNKKLPFDWPEVFDLSLGTPYQCYVYEFEEDCGWAALCLADDSVLAFLNSKLVNKETVEETRDYARKLMKRYYPSIELRG